MHFERVERERLREQIRQGWQAMAMIRRTLEQHAPTGSMPKHEFLADISEEATMLVAALERTLAARIKSAASSVA